jgi:prephenate dehydrogenase
LKRLGKLNVLIVGLGQIGGSIGLDLVAIRGVGHVVGYDRNKTESARALRHRAIDHIAPTLQMGVAEADIVILATPIKSIIALIPEVCRELKSDAAILDVGSTKQEILKAALRVRPKANFIGGHPIAGNEGHGFRSARRGQFGGATFVLTPSPYATHGWVKVVTQLVKRLGALSVIMTARRHDRIAALTIGLPNVLSIALMGLAARAGARDPEIWRLTGGSFQGATRVAVSSPDLMTQMLVTNNVEVSLALARLIADISRLKAAISRGDETMILKAIHAMRLKSGLQNPST